MGSLLSKRIKIIAHSTRRLSPGFQDKMNQLYFQKG